MISARGRRGLLSTLAALWLCISTSRAATVTLEVDGQPQRASLLCWAATSTMAVNWFNLPGGKVTQAQLAAYHSRGVESRQQYAELEGEWLQWVDDRVPYCDAHIHKCNDRNAPMLLGLKSVTGSPGMALKWQDLRAQIDQKRPVLFTWVYLRTRHRPESEHQLIIIGYREERGRKELLVWDPLPVANPLEIVPHATLKRHHWRWISYDKYRNPKVHAGRSAQHGKTTYNLAPEAIPASLPIRSLVTTGKAKTLDSAMRFQDALREAKDELRLIESQLNAPGGGNHRLGLPLPLVPLEDGDLVSENDHGRLMMNTTAVLLVPIEAQETLIDTFLLVRQGGAWLREGIIDHDLARKMLEQRAQAARETGVPLSEFYGVSLPQRGTFFTGFGYREAAQLYALATDRSIGTHAGRPRDVRSLFRDMTHQILGIGPGDDSP
jgi:hypothetical protein